MFMFLVILLVVGLIISAIFVINIFGSTILNVFSWILNSFTEMFSGTASLVDCIVVILVVAALVTILIKFALKILSNLG